MASNALRISSCSQCGESIIPGMVRCRHCGTLLSRFPPATQKVTTLPQTPLPVFSTEAYAATDPYASILAQAEILLNRTDSEPSSRAPGQTVRGFDEILASAPDYDEQRSVNAVRIVAKNIRSTQQPPPKQSKPTPQTRPPQVLPVPVVTPRPLVEVVKVNMGFPVEPPELVSDQRKLTPEQQALIEALDEFRYDDPVD